MNTQSEVLIRYTYRAWIGKPDPGGFGKAEFFVSASNLQREVEGITARGHRVDAEIAVSAA